MTTLQLRRVTFSFLADFPLFSDLDLHLDEGWTGVVGENGSGKTTLLRLITGELSPDAGSVAVDRSATVTLCTQVVARQDASIKAFSESTSHEAFRLRGVLGLDRAMAARFSSLSPGERKRFQIGAALWAAPSVLLLDEPTNHLDHEGRALLTSALAAFSGVGLIVSHDRTLLDALSSRTLRLGSGQAKLFAGGYSEAKATWESEERAAEDAHRAARSEEQRVKKWLDDARRERQASEQSRSSRHRMKDKNDHDARGSLAKGLAAKAEKRLGRVVSVARKKLDGASSRASSLAATKALGRSVFAQYERSPRRFVLRLDAREIRAGERVVLGKTRCDVARDARIRIDGRNGAGKTTLLRALLASAGEDADKMLYLPQETSAEEALRAVREVRSLPPEVRGRVLSLVAALGVSPDRLLGSASPSPGEARKLLIARGLGAHAWALLLDEPTNHLDLPSVERLEAALVAYPGALVLVTHDATFAKEATTATWRIEEGALCT